jgi:hypothetical protein
MNGRRFIGGGWTMTELTAQREMAVEFFGQIVAQVTSMAQIV